jgi:hypothetical protein
LRALYSPGLVVGLFWAWFASALLLLVGALTRPSALVCFVCSLYFLVLREPRATHAADWLIPSLAFHNLLLPSNRWLALDGHWFGARRDNVPAWPLRLAQLATAFFYFTAGTSKLADPVWRAGEGFYMTFANPLLSHFDFTRLAEVPVLSGFLSYTIMLWECAVPLLLMFRKTRVFALVSAAVFLVIVDLSLPVGWFAWFCLAALLLFADDVTYPGSWTARFEWLTQPKLPPPDPAIRRSWQGRVASAFLVFHLASFALLQLAYVCLAAGRIDLSSRLIGAPVLGAYGYLIANLRYYALWPSVFFLPVRFAYVEAQQPNGSVSLLPPLDDTGIPRVGWLESREIRDDMLLVMAPNAGTDQWRRHFAYLAERTYELRRVCPQKLSAYAIEVRPGSFGRDLRRGSRFLQSAYFDCEPEPKLVRVSAHQSPNE